MYNTTTGKFLIYENDVSWFFQDTKEKIEELITLTKNDTVVPIYYWNKIKVSEVSNGTHDQVLEYTDEMIGYASNLECVDLHSLDMLSKANLQASNRPVIVADIHFHPSAAKTKLQLLKTEYGSMISTVFSKRTTLAKDYSIVCLSFGPVEFLKRKF